MKRSSPNNERPTPANTFAPGDESAPASHETSSHDDERTLLQRRCEQLRAERDALSEVLATLGEAIVCTDLDGTVTFWNQAASELLGGSAEDWIGRCLFDWFPRGEMTRLFTLYREVVDGLPRALEWQDERRPATHWAVDIRLARRAEARGQPGGIVNVFRDVSERRLAEETMRRAERRKAELESQLFHAQKMETMGTLSSGIAHDFNNILTGILLQSEVALADPAAPPKLSSALKEIRAAGLRAKALVRRILNFSRRDEPEREPVDLATLLGEVVTFVRATLPPSIEIHADLATNCRATLADENRLHQVFVNLSSNAAAAMPNGGVLRFSLQETKLFATRALTTGVLAPGTYLAVSVADTGVGMSADTVRRMFEPFFTTKRSGEGTGLGLAIVASVVAEHGGGVQVESTPHAGSKLTIFLPVVDGGAPTRTTPTPARLLPRGNGEHVLVIDDEESLALLMRATLETLGYRVSHEGSALGVVAQLEATPDAFDLIVTDQNMPQLSGVELARRARAAGIELPIVIATGFAAPLDAREADGLRNLVVLEKPFEVEHLARLIRRLLDDRAALTSG